MSATVIARRPRRRRNYRLRRVWIETGSVLLGAAIVLWSLLPVYNMFMIALDPSGHNEFSGLLWPAHPTLTVFADLWSESADDVRNVWQQFGNSLFIGALATVLTVLVSSLASFAIGRMRLARQWTLTGTALLTYAIPAAVLIIPFIRIMQAYGLSDNLWAVVAAEVTFATPYAVLVLLYYARLVPRELDDAARIDGASVPQIYLRIYLPLMAPALAAVLGAGAVVMAVSGVLVAAQYSLVQATGEPPAFLGVFSACLGGGSVVASLVSSRILRRAGEGWLAVFGMADFAAGSALRATGVLGWALAGTVVLGFALPWVFLAVINLAQRVTPTELQGRVSAAVTLAMFGPQAPMQALGSLAIRYATFRQLYALGAIAALACAAYLARRASGHHALPNSSRPRPAMTGTDGPQQP